MKGRYLGYYSRRDLNSTLGEAVVLIPAGILRWSDEGLIPLDTWVFLSLMASLEASERSEHVIVAPPVYVSLSKPHVAEELLAKCITALIKDLKKVGFSRFVIVTLEKLSESAAEKALRSLEGVEVIGPKTLSFWEEKYASLILSMWREVFPQTEEKYAVLFSSEDRRKGIKIWRTVVKEILCKAESLRKRRE